MKKDSIKEHLREYSIYQRRKTTINHAFASAIAPVDQYDEATISAALKLLGQDPNGELACVYCDRPAETWDHLESLVEKGNFRGYGHIIGNLVPCCKQCNSAKGAKSWREFVKDPQIEKALEQYVKTYAQSVDLAQVDPQLVAEYTNLKEQILELMEEADKIAAEIRKRLQEQREHHSTRP